MSPHAVGSVREEGLEAYAHLAEMATHRRSIAYRDLERLLDARPGQVGQILGALAEWCREREYPPLTVIVYHGETGLPWEGVYDCHGLRDADPAAKATWRKQAKATVFAFNWQNAPLSRDDS